MRRDFRTWYLLFCLRIKKKNAVASPHEMTGVAGIADGNFFFFGKHIFLKELAKKKFFVFNRSIKSQRKRMDEDDSILDECINATPQKIVQRTAEEVGLWREEWRNNVGDLRSNTPLIRITGSGESFASITNFLFVYLLNKYKALWLIIWGIFLLTIWPILHPVVCTYTQISAWCPR